jgi:hypothetical protein
MIAGGEEGFKVINPMFSHLAMNLVYLARINDHFRSRRYRFQDDGVKRGQQYYDKVVPFL